MDIDPTSPARFELKARIESGVAAAIVATSDPREALGSALRAVVGPLGCIRGAVWGIDPSDPNRRERLAATGWDELEVDGPLLSRELRLGGRDVGVLDLVAPEVCEQEVVARGSPTLVHLAQAVERAMVRADADADELARRTAELEHVSAELETSATLLEERNAVIEESYEKIERANRELEVAERIQAALRRVAVAVAEERDLDEVASLAAREVARVAGAAGAVVLKVVDDLGVVAGGWTRPGLPCPQDGATVSLDGDLPSARAVRSGRLESFGDISRAEGRPLWNVGVFERALAVPVVSESESWGAVVVAYRRGEEPDEGVSDRLRRIADLVGLAVANADGRERVLADAVSDMFGGEWDANRTLQAVVEAARRSLRADRASCYLHSDDGSTIDQVFTTASDVRTQRYLTSAVGKQRSELPIWQGLLASTQPVLVVGDVQRDPAIPAEMRAALRAGAFIGIRLEHASVGTRDGAGLVGSLFLSFDRPRNFRRRQRDIARSLGSVAAMAIANARLHASTIRSLAELERRAFTDHLTGLVNHRRFQEQLHEGFEAAAAESGPLSLAVFDIDDFSDVNARFGHAAGDEVLREVATRLESALGGEGVLGRVGGEEFAWVTGGEPDEAWGKAESARAAVAETPIPGVRTVTVSAGFADTRHGHDADELLRLAHGALYWAKSHGRDAAFRYSREVVEVLSSAEQANRLQRSQALQSIRVLARAVDAKDPSTAEHSERVADLSVSLAAALGWETVEAARLRDAGLVHDVGKISVPDAILFKPGSISGKEFKRVRAHAAIGAAMVDGVLADDQVSWVRGHHERWDGRGYPDGLVGEAIPEGARLIALADAWDVITSARPYKRALTHEEALEEIRASSGSHFWPEAVEAIERIISAGALPADIARTADSRPRS